jgi:hypothetical protein
MAHLIDYKEDRTLDGAKPYKSTRLQQENDCGQAKARLLYMSLHSETMAGGELVLSDAALERWEAVLPGTGRETVWKFACGEAVERVAGCSRATSPVSGQGRTHTASSFTLREC